MPTFHVAYMYFSTEACCGQLTAVEVRDLSRLSDTKHDEHSYWDAWGRVMLSSFSGPTETGPNLCRNGMGFSGYFTFLELKANLARNTQNFRVKFWKVSVLLPPPHPSVIPFWNFWLPVNGKCPRPSCLSLPVSLKEMIKKRVQGALRWKHHYWLSDIARLRKILHITWSSG